MVDALAAGEEVLERRGQVLARFAEVVDLGRQEPDASGDPSDVTAEGVIGAIASVLHARLLENSSDALVDLLGPLMSMIVLPYLGARAATRELRTERRPCCTATGGGSPAARTMIR